MKYIEQIYKGFISSSILLFSISIIVYIFFPVKYIGDIDAVIIIKVVLITAFIGIILEIAGGVFYK